MGLLDLAGRFARGVGDALAKSAERHAAERFSYEALSDGNLLDAMRRELRKTYPYWPSFKMMSSVATARGLDLAAINKEARRVNDRIRREAE